MPTGYTAGILDGKITTFPQFAKVCLIAFGAAIHLRDEDMHSELTKITPSDYYATEIEKAKQLLKNAETLSDKLIVQNKKLELEKSKEYHLKAIEKSKVDVKNLNDILKEIYQWSPPTDEHTGIKDFMIDQIKQTIDFDCKTKYHEDNISKIQLELLILNPSEIRKSMIEKGKKDFEYNTKNYNKDVLRCDNSNQWISDFISSLSK
jgi:hypothetical protein